ncbi:MAG: hypothetical protein K6U87_06990 [Firmicutes bacterium]|nr:hypothetical protein [Bacillota bacterium]
MGSRLPCRERLLVDEVHQMALAVVAASSRNDLKWRMSDGDQVWHVVVADVAFLNRVSRCEEPVAKGDILVGDVRIRQHQTAVGLRTEYILEKVREHRRVDAFAQFQFPCDDAGHQDPSPD